MSEIPSRNDILAASSESGLMGYLFEVAPKHVWCRKPEFLATVAELVGSSERTLFTEKDWTFLNGMSGPSFFHGMALLCELIPLLDVGHRDMMQLVKTLVHLGGEDLAAQQPNVAFRSWCSADPARVRAVLDDARVGDNLAIDHLCFALEVGAESADAMAFLKEGPAPEVQMGAAAALGRMALDAEDAAPVVRSLSEVSIKADDPRVRINALLSSFAVLEKNPELPREDARRALVAALDDTSAETLNALSALVWRHGKSLSEDEGRWLLTALQSIDPEHRGTLQQIDFATPDLLSGGYSDALFTLVAELVRRSQGRIGLNDFPNLRRELVDGDLRRLSKLAIKWLLEGNPHLCLTLAEQFDAVGAQQTTFELQVEDMPVDPDDQLFLCRKAVGFLFHTPVTAASVLIAVIRHGDNRIIQDLLNLLSDPLLINFGGELRLYLDQVVERTSDPRVARIGEALTRRQKELDDLVGIETLVELHPSEIHRQIERARWNRHMAQVMKKGMEESVVFNLVHKQHILYGTKSSSYIDDPSGDTRQVNVEMGSHSVTFEYPHSDILDPEGLHMKLFELRYEQRTRL
ncbi:MAG: hypothetical protein OXF11_13155 [Deltaproteobacteria bacterium]|nr:hypothetical protein [Deltaproteobacteria bacterium]